MIDELRETVDSLIDLDEPEALLTTLKRAAKRRKGERWRKLAQALEAAEDELAALNETEPQPEKEITDFEEKSE